jgi:hypothetical protein
LGYEKGANSKFKLALKISAASRSVSQRFDEFVATFGYAVNIAVELILQDIAGIDKVLNVFRVSDRPVHSPVVLPMRRGNHLPRIPEMIPPPKIRDKKVM